MSDLVDRLRALPWHEPAIAEAADEIERLTAERDRAVREKNGLFDAVRDKKPTTVNVQVASTGQQDEIERLRAEHRIQNDCIADQHDTIRRLRAVYDAAANLVRAEGWQIERDNLWDALHDLIDKMDEAALKGAER